MAPTVEIDEVQQVQDKQAKIEAKQPSHVPDETVFCKLLSPHAKAPARGSEEAAGSDLASIEDVKVPARGSVVVSTGIALMIPRGLYGRVTCRSGMAIRYGIDVGAGVIDSDYRGEIKVLLRNNYDEDFNIKAGDSIAQIVIEKYSPAVFEICSELPETKRGEKGFGSTDTPAKPTAN